jgi:hypothetical protein
MDLGNLGTRCPQISEQWSKSSKSSNWILEDCISRGCLLHRGLLAPLARLIRSIPTLDHRLSYSATHLSPLAFLKLSPWKGRHSIAPGGVKRNRGVTEAHHPISLLPFLFGFRLLGWEGGDESTRADAVALPDHPARLRQRASARCLNSFSQSVESAQSAAGTYSNALPPAPSTEN